MIKVVGGSRAQEKAGSCFRFRHDATAQVQCPSLESLLGSYPTYPPSIYCELLYTDSKKARAQNHKCRALYLLPATGVRVVRFCARACEHPGCVAIAGGLCCFLLRFALPFWGLRKSAVLITLKGAI